MEERSIEIFDNLREGEEVNFTTSRSRLGKSFALSYELIRLYDTLIELSIPHISELDAMQFPALLHSLQWLRNEAIAGTMTLLRGHITDSSNFSRRAIEIGAFVTKMYKDPESAKHWMEAGKSNNARQKYQTSFPAWQLVKEFLPAKLIPMYDYDCLNVHPSHFAVAKRASLTDDRTHTFEFFDLDPEDTNQCLLVITYFNISLWHGELMLHLANLFSGSSKFDLCRWNQEYQRFVDLVNAEQKRWLPIIQGRMQEHTAAESAEKKEQKAAAKAAIKAKRAEQGLPE